MQLFLLSVFDFLQLLPQGRRAENAAHALGRIAQPLAVAVEDLIGRGVAVARLAIEDARHGAAAEHPAIAAAETEETTGTARGTAVAAEHLGDKARRQHVRVDKDIAQRWQAISRAALFEQRREAQRRAEVAGRGDAD